MVALVDDGHLTITLEDALHAARLRWKMVFAKYPAYRNILEEHRLELWQHLDQTQQRCGNTFVVPNSPWIASFSPMESLEVFYPTLGHYLIATEDDVIEVLSPQPPVIASLGETSPETPKPGKAQHLYYPQDHEQIEHLVKDIQARQHRRKE